MAKCASVRSWPQDLRARSPLPRRTGAARRGPASPEISLERSLNMMTVEQSKLITETGEGTPAGDLLRRYWQPAALSEELSGARPVRPVRLFGRDLVLF